MVLKRCVIIAREGEGEGDKFKDTEVVHNSLLQTHKLFHHTSNLTCSASRRESSSSSAVFATAANRSSSSSEVFLAMPPDLVVDDGGDGVAGQGRHGLRG